MSDKSDKSDKSEKSSPLQNLLESFSRCAYGTSREECMRNRKCIKCKNDAIQFRDVKSAKEYHLSGWCQNCQDAFFGA